MSRFNDRVVIVTGAASGIGRACAVQFAKEGASVACADVNEEGLAEAVGEITTEGGTAMAIPTDVSDPTSVHALVEKAVESYGKLNVMCNAAGIGGFKHTTEVEPEFWSKMIGVNLSGVFYGCRYALPHLLETKGNIVNIASIAGVAAHPYAAAYCASKGGVVMMTKALAMEYGEKGVRVNAICPGGIKTPMLEKFAPLPDGNMQLLMRMMMLVGRFGRPYEIGNMAAYIASDDGSFMTGSIVKVDGGSTL